MEIFKTQGIDLEKIKNIIFDLGGVIFNVDYHKTLDEFKKLGLENFEQLYSQLQQTDLFDKLETGKISPAIFRNKIRQHISKPLTDEKIDAAWNAMILDTPKERLDVLSYVKSHFRTFLLSNTNEIHIDYFNKHLLDTFGIHDLSEYFEKLYFSYQIGLRKPDKEVFDYVIRINKLNPAETLFIDDTFQHIEGARKAGLQGFHLTNGETINRLFRQ
jgi:putative hydrolase of the HAD superfamily